ncbi:hypothetical protein [Methyloceanibacter sp.]|uniref:hypothetical protein n=1 Tax=Methyloceanibacter sp. TaxID=1965321 RepID=UPI002BE7BDB4|nr:hypothetical protein [Methyloceanibacter sp.]HML91229.1 hypothetical protein [Methyloceanibacter sp.]
MSLTPNEITDRAAVERRKNWAIAGAVALVLAYLFSGNPDAGAGVFWLFVFGIACFVFAWKTKTKLKKQGEVGLYGKGR